MLIADILRAKGADVETVAADATLQEAVGILARRRIGALPVSRDGRRIDGIVRRLAEAGTDLSAQRVEGLMVADVRTCGPGATVAEVMRLMNDHRIRHVPVVVDDGVLAGLVSIRDIVEALLQEAETERLRMEAYISDRTAS